MKRIVTFWALMLSIAPYFAQYKQINIASTVLSSTANSFTMQYQSVDGSSTCSGKIEFTKINQELAQISLSFNACSSVFPGIPNNMVLAKITKTDKQFLFADNDAYSARFMNEAGTYKLEKIISKSESHKYTYHFDYNLNVASVPVRTMETGKEVKPSTKSTEGGTYLVEEGDYIYKIARNTNCSPSYLMKINNIQESEILYPGRVIKICDGSSYVQTAPKSSSSGLKMPLGNDLEKIKRDYESLSQLMSTSGQEILSLKTYGEELRKDYEQLVKEFNALNASYNNLIEEYKESVLANKTLTEENERLKQLLRERNINPDQELTAQEKQKVEALQQQIQTVRSQIQDMKSKMDEVQAPVQEEKKVEEPKVVEPAPVVETPKAEPVPVETQAPAPQKVAEPVVENTMPSGVDPKFEEFCTLIKDRVMKDEKTTRLHVERILSYKVQDQKVKEITSVSTNELIGNKLDKKKKVSDYIQTVDIFALMNLKYPSFKSSKEYINTRLNIDVQKVTYSISVSESNFKVKDSSRDLSNVRNNDPHFMFIKEELKKNNIQDGKMEVMVIEETMQLDYQTDADLYEILHRHTKLSMLNIEKK